MASKIASFYGNPGVGKKTLAGSLIYKCGGIGLLEIEQLEGAGTKSYDAIQPFLSGQGKEAFFYTPTAKWIIMESPNPDVIIYVIDATLSGSSDSWATELTKVFGLKLNQSAGKLVFVLNKMDKANWSQQIYTEMSQKIRFAVKESGYGSRIFIVPASALLGDNILEPSTKLSWYGSATSGNVRQDLDCTKTLIEAIDA